MSRRLDVERVAQSALDPDETLRWVGQPDPKRLALQHWPQVLFGLPWTAFAVFWVVGAARMSSHGPWRSSGFDVFPLFGIPFILIGLGIVSAPLWAYRKAGHTVYAISDKRLLILQGRTSRAVQAFDARRIGAIAHTTHADGSGDVLFADEVGTYHGRYGSYTAVTRIGFFGVPDVCVVERLVRDVAQRNNAGVGRHV